MIYIFLIATGFIVYTYALFPLLLHIRAGRKSPLNTPPLSHWPTTSIVIASCNEIQALRAKLVNLEQLDYPPEHIEWIIISNGSTDGSETLLRDSFFDFPNRKYKHLTKQLGKSSALKVGVAMASGSVIVFMDARQRVSNDALRMLVPHLQYPSIGAVSGELLLSSDTSLSASNMCLYWKYEKWIRDNESRLFSTTGASGGLYAIRKADFKPNRNATLLNEFDTPVGLLKQGKRTLFIPGAYVFDKAPDNIRKEFQLKVRNLVGNWQSFQQNAWLFNPLKNKVWWQFLSHKVFRLLVPYALIAAFISALLGDSLMLDIMFAAQLLFYVLVAASYLQMPGTRNKAMNMIKIIIQLNIAAIVATIGYPLHKRRIRSTKT